MIGVVREVMAGLRNRCVSDYGEPYLSGEHYTCFPFSEDKFEPFEPYNDERNVCFIDGGNNEIWSTPSSALHVVRLYYSIFRGVKRTRSEKFDYIVNSSLLNDKIECRIRDVSGKAVLIPEMLTVPGTEARDIDTTHRAKPSAGGGLVRKYIEWALLSKLTKELGKGDIAVRDGTLQTGVMSEKEYADDAYSACLNSGVILVGVAKTSTLLTTTGYPLLAAIHSLSRRWKVEPPWYYHPVAENRNPDHRGEVYVAKLHPRSKYVFRLEVERETFPRLSDDDIARVFGIFSVHSKDPIFLGYPYGLIDADRNARVTDSEVKFLRNLCINEMDEELIYEVNALSAHDILSNI